MERLRFIEVAREEGVSHATISSAGLAHFLHLLNYPAQANPPVRLSPFPDT